MGSATEIRTMRSQPDNLTIPAGSLSASSNLTLNNDTLTEGDETILIEIGSVNGGNELPRTVPAGQHHHRR